MSLFWNGFGALIIERESARRWRCVWPSARLRPACQFGSRSRSVSLAAGAGFTPAPANH